MIKDIEFSDAINIKNMIITSSSIATPNVLKEILDSIRDTDKSIVKKLVIDGTIVGIWISTTYEEHVSLSYFYTDPSIRMKPIVYSFFTKCMVLLPKGLPIIIKANDITGFERYVKKLDGADNLYVLSKIR